MPEDPQTNDRVLLQDIYAQIDLEQFALDPDEPIEQVELPRDESEPIHSVMRYDTVHQHPYLHLFPSLREDSKGWWKSETYDQEYDPYRTTSKPDRFQDISLREGWLTYFIYNPWFEPIYIGRARGAEDQQGSYVSSGEYGHEKTGVGPYWFGNNSTRGVLAETVAALLEEARLPDSVPAKRPWLRLAKRGERGAGSLDAEPGHEWTMREFISTSISGQRIDSDPSQLLFRCERSSEREERQECNNIQHHFTPWVKWEILHPQLPIVRVTAHAEQALPLEPPGYREPLKSLEEIPSEARGGSRSGRGTRSREG